MIVSRQHLKELLLLLLIIIVKKWNKKAIFNIKLTSKFNYKLIFINLKMTFRITIVDDHNFRKRISVSNIFIRENLLRNYQ